MHGRYKDTRYGVAGGCTRSATDTLWYTGILVLAIGGVIAVELATTLTVGPGAAAAGVPANSVGPEPVAVRPFEDDTPSQGRPSASDAAGGPYLNPTPRFEASDRAHAATDGAGDSSSVAARPPKTATLSPPWRPPADASAEAGGRVRELWTPGIRGMFGPNCTRKPRRVPGVGRPDVALMLMDLDNGFVPVRCGAGRVSSGWRRGSADPESRRR